MKMFGVAWVLVIVVGGLAFFMFSYSQKPAHSVTLRWSPTPYATSYYIYRAAVSGGPYRKIGTTPYPRYADVSVTSGAVFYYVVTADRKGKESAYSAEVRAAIP